MFEQQITELKAELADAKASREALEKEVSARKDSEFQAKVNTFETTISEKDGAINELTEGLQNSEAKVAELEASLAEKEEAIVEASSKIEAFEASQKADGSQEPTS